MSGGDLSAIQRVLLHEGALEVLESETAWYPPAFYSLSYLCDNSGMDIHERRIELYVAADGRAPFEEWMRTLRDKTSKARIFSRIDRPEGIQIQCQPRAMRAF